MGGRNAVAMFAMSVALAPLKEGIEAGKKDEATTALSANGEQAIFQIMRESLITGAAEAASEGAIRRDRVMRCQSHPKCRLFVDPIPHSK